MHILGFAEHFSSFSDAIYQNTDNILVYLETVYIIYFHA